MNLLRWDIYEITTISTPITGVMLRGKIRKLCLENNKNVLVENAEDLKDVVRFAVVEGEEISIINNYLKKIVPDLNITKVRESVPNPVLSKLKINLEGRYTL